ncbi:hypothetical protein RRG08_059688, partial [Elysia crispata]
LVNTLYLTFVSQNPLSS